MADVLRYSEGDDALDALGRLLEWGHLVPTAPDTLAAYPFADNDPFVLRAAPHVLFAGNQPALATRLVTGARPPGAPRSRRAASGAGCSPACRPAGRARLPRLSSHAHRTILSGWRGSDCRARCPALSAEAGCRRCGAGREGQQVRLVCIPRFCDSGVLVLVNLETLHVHPITFNASMGA